MLVPWHPVQTPAAAFPRTPLPSPPPPLPNLAGALAPCNGLDVDILLLKTPRRVFLKLDFWKRFPSYLTGIGPKRELIFQTPSQCRAGGRKMLLPFAVGICPFRWRCISVSSGNYPRKEELPIPLHLGAIEGTLVAVVKGKTTTISRVPRFGDKPFHFKWGNSFWYLPIAFKA